MGILAPYGCCKKINPVGAYGIKDSILWDGLTHFVDKASVGVIGNKVDNFRFYVSCA